MPLPGVKKIRMFTRKSSLFFSLEFDVCLTIPLTPSIAATDSIAGRKGPMRLGDDIDDHCSACKRTTDHAIVSLVGEEVLRTRCRTCNSEHKYRGNKGRKKEMTARDAFDTLLASVTGAKPEEPKKPSRTKKK
jgi:hypothetical protein